MNASSKKRAVVYCRVSTNKEEQETSIKNQRKSLRKLCEDKDWTIPHINVTGICENGIYYDEGVSGTKLKRPAFSRLLLDAGLEPVIDADTRQTTTTYKANKRKTNKFDYIVVKDTSRFSRNINVNSILQSLKENDVYVYFSDLNKSTENDADWTYISIFFTLAEAESRRKRDAVSFGYESGIRAGKIYVGGKIIGYDYHKESNSLTVNEEEAKLVKRVYDLYTEEHLGHHRICKQLEKEGFKNSNGKVFTRSTISRMLKNEKYCGITTSGRFHKVDLFSNKKIERDYNDPVREEARKVQKELREQGIERIPAIIDIEQFKKAQEITAKNRNTYKVSKEWHGTTDYSKLVVCGSCGAFYRASGRKAYKKYGDQKISRYVCKHSITYDGDNKCNNPSVLEPELDKALFSIASFVSLSSSLGDMASGYERAMNAQIRELNKDKDEREKRKQEITNNLTKEKAKREKLYELFTIEGVNASDLKTLNTEINNNVASLEQELAEISRNDDDINEDISLFKGLTKIYSDCKKEVDHIIETNAIPNIPRKEMLRNVSEILIDNEGTPHVLFDSRKFIDYESIKIMLYNHSEQKKKRKTNS